MDGHLVAVEVGVERRTHHRVQTDGLTLDEHGLERLNRQTVERRSAVEEHGFVLRHLFEDIPHLGILTLDHLAGGTDGVALADLLQAADDERLEKSERHLLGKTALRELKLRSDDDNRTSGVVDALTEKVLAEAARLALENLGEGLKSAVTGACDGTAMAAVVEDRVDGFLKHALLVADNDVGSLEREKIAKTVVAVDDAAVEIVEIARRETAALQRDERTKLRRDDGKNVQNHPLGLGVGNAEALYDLHALGDFLAALLGARILHIFLKLAHELIEIDLSQELADGFRAHLGLESVVFLLSVGVFLIAEDLTFLERGVAGLDDHPVLVVENALEFARRLVEQKPDARGGALEEPDVAYGNGKLDVAHALTAHGSESNLDSAAVADHTLVLDALVLAAGALPVLRRSEDLLAEETFLLGTVGTVVDRLGILYLAVRPSADRLGRSELNLDRIIMGRGVEGAAENIGSVVRIIHFLSLLKCSTVLSGG